MQERELAAAATPAQLSAAVDLYRDDVMRLHHAHPGAGESVRQVSYRGHDIRIVTSYRIELDGAPVTGHFMVNNAGRVHYHAIPNQEFGSAVDVVKRIVDLSVGLDDGPAPVEGSTHPHGG